MSRSRHALLVGVPERDVSGDLDGVLGVDAMTSLLDDLGGWSVTVCTGARATRAEVLRGLDAMTSACQSGDACLFYFFGHGGVVRFSGLPGELGRRVVFYLATLRPMGSRERVGVLDVELSIALARLDRICGNVTAIIDCCHAASMVRDGPIPTVSPPAWVNSVVDDHEGSPAQDLLLAAEGHPRIVRLFGSSSLRSAYATPQTEGRYGLLSQCFVDVVREAGLRCERLTWDTVAHRAREWASRQRGTEEQRVVLAGPRHRLLFSRRTVPQPRSAAFVPGPTDDRGWIRAGLLQGVRVGDRWSIADLVLDDALEPRFRSDARVESVALDSAEVVLSAPSSRPPLGATAVMQQLAKPLPVVVDGVPAVNEALRSSGLVHATTHGVTDPVAIVCASTAGSKSPDAVDISTHGGRGIWLDFALDGYGLSQIVELLEDRARARRLEESLAEASPSSFDQTDIVLRWGTFGTDDELRELPVPGSETDRAPRLRVGDRLWLEIGHRASTPRRWFASVLSIDIEGRLTLLNTHEPDGIEIAPGPPIFVGLRGHRHRQGLTCSWPPRVPTDGPRVERLVLLASRRPIPLGHLVRLPEPDDPTAFAAQGLGFVPSMTARGDAPRPFVVSREWTCKRLRFELDPNERTSTT